MFRNRTIVRQGVSSLRNQTSKFRPLLDNRTNYRAFHTQSQQQQSHTHNYSKLWLASGLALGISLYLGKDLFSHAHDHKEKSEPVEYIEGNVGKVGDLKPGEMKEVVVNDVKLLLSNANGTLHATGLKCSHYGAPLNKGALAGEVVYCPWHAAAFSVVTGKSEGAPALDDIPVYTVRIENDNVFVSIPKTAKTDDKVAPARKGHLCNCSSGKAPKTFVILGGGGSGLVAAQTLRQEGFKGRVVLITKEDELPYDRPMLSKQVGIPKEKVTLRDDQFFKTHDIEVHRGVEVNEVDTQGRKIKFSDGSDLTYDSVLLATGATPIVLPIPGNGLSGVHTLRSYKDSKELAEDVEGKKKIVVIGSGFIGLEVSSWLRKAKNLDVTIVALEKVPFENVLGKEVGSVFQKLAEENGVKFKLNTSVKEITGNGKVDSVVLQNGEKLEADLVVMGTGVKPATKMIKGLDLHPRDGSVIVDSKLRAGENVYAAGDIATFPYFITGENVRVEHWQNAQDQGRVAAKNMLGKNLDFNRVPFFWTNQFGVGLRYVGYAPKYDEVIIDGDLNTRKFVAYFIRNGKIAAVAAMGKDPYGPAAVELFSRDAFPSLDEIRKGNVDLHAHLTKVTTEQK
eukprot:TRINITY_DN6985_c0_g1_i1.p1 TRINITY_DN6985_c0_g1~~TRINITY_DN6985_c0_g1_i1.p1  ORF type:complete len:622 (+),score=147.53 TRINITY_DN6985_c0_g1_i1:98-1963(+)